MSIEAVIGLALTVVGAGLGLMWKVAVWKTQREQGEAHAKDDTRLTIKRLEPKLDALIEVNQRQSETLAVIVHRTDGVERQVKELATVVDSHGNRITKLETKETKS